MTHEKKWNWKAACAFDVVHCVWEKRARAMTRLLFMKNDIWEDSMDLLLQRIWMDFERCTYTLYAILFDRHHIVSIQRKNCVCLERIYIYESVHNYRKNKWYRKSLVQRDVSLQFSICHFNMNEWWACVELTTDRVNATWQNSHIHLIFVFYKENKNVCSRSVFHIPCVNLNINQFSILCMSHCSMKEKQYSSVISASCSFSND